MQNVYCAGASTMTWAALMNWSTLPSSAWGGLCTATCGSLIRWVTASHHRTALHACHSSILPFWKLRQPAEDRFIHPWWAVSDARQPYSSFHLIIFGTVLVRILPYTSCSSLQGVARPSISLFLLKKKIVISSASMHKFVIAQSPNSCENGGRLRLLPVLSALFSEFFSL